MDSNKTKKRQNTEGKVLDYMFWFIFLFINPAGVPQQFGEDSSSSGIDVTDILFFTLCIFLALNFKKK